MTTQLCINSHKAAHKMALGTSMDPHTHAGRGLQASTGRAIYVVRVGSYHCYPIYGFGPHVVKNLSSPVQPV